MKLIGQNLRLGLLNLLIVSWSFGADSSPEAALSERIARVENGLAPAVRLVGAPEEKWSVSSRLAFHRVPGVSIAVIDEGKLVWARAYGLANAATKTPLTPGALLRAASISKPVAAVAALRLVESGVVSLDGDVNEALTSWQIPRATVAQGKPVTLRQLLSHSSGLATTGQGGYVPGQPLPTLLQVLDGVAPATSTPVRLEAQPGTKVRYGVGHAVIEQLLVDLEKKPFTALIRARVFTPAGMADSSFEEPLPSSLASRAARGHDIGGAPIAEPRTYVTKAAGGLWTTPTDIARFTLDLIASLHGRPGILSRETAETMLTLPLPGSPWALGLHRVEEGGEPRLSHGGNTEGFKSILVFYPRSQRGAVVMTNGDNGVRLFAEILRSLAREYRWPGYGTAQKSVVRLAPDALARFTGKFEREDGQLVFSRDGTRFFVESGTLLRTELFAESDRTFFSVESPDVFSFTMDSSGTPIRVTRIGATSQEFERVAR